MGNPWLHIPAADYEGHMSSPKVDQLSFLASTFKEALEQHNCTTVALLGGATGNGIEYVDRDATRKITVIDFNPEYLKIIRQRYEASVAGLEIIEADLETCAFENQAYSLIYGGLIFEYLDPRKVLPTISGSLYSGGVLVIVLQLPAEHLNKISDTPYASIKKLESIMKLISPQEFKVMANEAGLREVNSKIVTLKSGKPFFIGTYSN